jgi:glucose-6-phosphate isomerase
MRLALGSYGSAHRDTLERLGKDDAVRRIWSGDASLWKREESHRRVIENALGWLTIADRMAASLADLEAFVSQTVRDTDHVVVLGMGGSSLAPLVFGTSFPASTGFPALEVLDSTEPSAVDSVGRRCDPARTIYVVSSKSGTTLEPNILFDYFYELANRALGDRAGERFVIVTDPGSALEKEAGRRRVRRVFPGDPKIGGRYSALSNFGVVPAALAGIPVAELLSRARDMADRCRRAGEENPGLALGAALGAMALRGRDKLTFSVGRPIDRFGMWLEQLVAESTGKEGRGILPVEGEAVGSPEDYGDDRFFVSIGPPERGFAGLVAPLAAAGHPAAYFDVSDAIDLGAEMFRWEFATAVAGAVLGIDPFDQPNVQEAKDRTNEILNAEGGRREAGDGPGIDRGALARLLGSIRPHDYFAITAYLPSTTANEDALAAPRLRVRDRKKVATTLGFGPRFLHSTGQLHKGGPDTGVFLQVTAKPAEEAPIPGKPWGFAEVVAAQAAGDLAALQSRGRRALRVHLTGGVKKGLGDLDAAIAAALETLEKERG